MTSRSQQTLEDYLQGLLTPVEELARVSEQSKPLTPVLKSSVEKLLAQIPIEQAVAPVVAPAVVAPEVVAQAVVSVTPDAKVESVTKAFAEATPTEQPMAALMAISTYKASLPAQFQTLIFSVGKLQLALPLHLLGGIIKSDDAPTPIFGQPKWFTGLLQTNTGGLNVINTGMYLLDHRYEPEMAEGYRYVIRLGDSNWGLSVSELCSTRVLEHEAIRWFPDDNGRPWIAGMIKEDRCALLNVPALMQRFQNESQKKPASGKKATILDGKTGARRGGRRLS
ncbi:chemotaxis protein CheW [Permianibacter aggregans]|uniref:Purine-binding chemotaxis protein CheW n=1 Tax=Permianibacter aggregans TaxID=1510150 RepID=A0A4R6UN68_9GAMM|nr:chemotaxis protein CheW [Permianibacter aggregans]QGX38254.1 hypothetical protein E2H98_00645 [Permianibacter aggregans]TDQ48568.1 purine-binding chemotaxis protein CheW [Permianibacter aggregans]